MEKHIIVDTNINFEENSKIALTYLLRCDDLFKIDAITIAPDMYSGLSGKLQEEKQNISYETARRTCGYSGIDSINIYRGSLNYLKHGCGKTNEAVEKIIELALKNEKTYILCMGTPTNIALAIMKNPEIINKIEIIWAGGNELGYKDNSEPNFKDIDAVRKLYESKVKLTIIPCNDVAYILLTSFLDLNSELTDSVLREFLFERKYDWKFWERANEYVDLWHVATVAYMVNREWFTEMEVDCPIILPDTSYKQIKNDRKVTFITSVNRELIFKDLFKRLERIEYVPGPFCYDYYEIVKAHSLNKKSQIILKTELADHPERIQNYNEERSDYIELVSIAIKNKPDVIRFVHLADDTFLEVFKKAAQKDPTVITYFDSSLSNYNKLYNIAIEAFEETIQIDPSVIARFDSSFLYYNKLCNIAYEKNKESLKYMDINRVDELVALEIIAREPEKIKLMDINQVGKLVALEIIAREPEKIKLLDRKKDFYKEALKLALELNGKMINDIELPNFKKNYGFYFELINAAYKSAPEIEDNCLYVIYALILENRKRKRILLNIPNILGDNIIQLLNEIEAEYKLLLNKYVQLQNKEIEASKHNFKLMADIDRDILVRCRNRQM